MRDTKISKYKIKKYLEDSKKTKSESKEIPLNIQKLLKIADGDY